MKGFIVQDEQGRVLMLTPLGLLYIPSRVKPGSVFANRRAAQRVIDRCRSYANSNKFAWHVDQWEIKAVSGVAE